MKGNTNRFSRGAVNAAVALVVAAGVVSSFSACGESASPPAAPPNIVLITADDLGWRDLGCFGDEQVKTPNLDTLCEAGIRFTNAFVTASSCSASRASLLTGQYPHTNGVDSLVHRYPEKSLPAGYPTLASLLAGAGYRTAIQGKWHLSVNDAPEALGYHENLSDAFEQLVSNDLDIEKSLAFIERNRDTPFYLEINSKHNHRLPNGEFEFDPDFPVDPDSVQPPDYWHLPAWPEIRLELAKYYSQTQRLDWIVGQVMDKLNDLGLAETTLYRFSRRQRTALSRREADAVRSRNRHAVDYSRLEDCSLRCSIRSADEHRGPHADLIGSRRRRDPRRSRGAILPSASDWPLG